EKSFCPPSCSRCLRSCIVYDTGFVSVTVNCHGTSSGYGQNGIATTPGTVAKSLAAASNADCSSPVWASASGAVVTLTARTFGTATNYSLSATSGTSDPPDFGTPSFTATRSGPNLTGGTN